MELENSIESLPADFPDAVVVDLETTGLHVRSDRIIEIGALRLRGGRVTDTLSVLIDPGFPLTEHITDLTGITPDMLRGKEKFAECADRVLSFLGEDVLIGHRITTDYAFLKKAFVDAYPKGFVFERRGIDTLKLSRNFLPADEKKNLSAACSHYGLTFPPHRAMEDAKATLFLLEKLWEEFGEKSPLLFEPKPLRYAVKRDTPIMKKQIEQIERLISEKGIAMDFDPAGMTKSSASRFIDQIRSGQYGNGGSS